MNLQRRIGFTMIEMLVVVAIIALLVALLLPSLQKARAVAQRAHCGATLKQVAIALFMYDGDNGELPSGKWNAALGVTYGQYALRTQYGLRGRNVICPTMEDDTQTHEDWARNWWDLEPDQSTANHRAFMGYIYWAGASTRNSDTGSTGIKGWGWVVPSLAKFGLFPSRSAARDFGFPADASGGSLYWSRSPDEMPIMKDFSYFSPNKTVPIAPHNFFPFYASHREGNAQNAAGTNVLFLDGHVTWHNLVLGESWVITSWTIDQNTHTGSNNANAMLWTPTFAAPTDGGHPNGPQRLFLN